MGAAAKACQQCRAAKRKCVRCTDFGPCVPCLGRSILCSNTRRMTGEPLLAPGYTRVRIEGEEEDNIELPRETVTELVEHYIDKIHDRPHSLFHLPTLRESIRTGNMKMALILAICAMGSTFSPHPDIRLLRDRLTVQSKKLLLKNLEDICLESIQTCILVANLCAANASPSSEALFFRIAVSMAQILRLTSLQPGDTLVVHEVKRRIWWSLFMADCWYSSGLNLPRQIQDRERPAALPMDESIFHSLAIGKESLGGPHKLGLWAHMITLVDLFGPIQDLNRRIVQEDLEDNEIDRCAYDISQRIEDWEKTLPLDAKFNEENLREHKRRGTGGPFIALHLGFHHYSTLLYFQYLDVKRATTVDTKLYAERCKHHASSYSALLKVARSEEGLAAVYLTVGHMAVISSSVLLHTLLFDDEHRIRSARDSLNANFEALIELEQYWPALKSIINRLIEFQNMCLLSATSHTHVLSKWMLRFLIEYALPIERDTTIVDTSVTGPELQVVSIDTQRLEEQGRFTTFPTYEAKS